MIPHVIEARHVKDHIVWLKFDDGACGELDLSHELDGPIFEPLRDIAFFRQFLIRYNTLSWKNGADFAPEFLREKLAQQILTRNGGVLEKGNAAEYEINRG